MRTPHNDVPTRVTSGFRLPARPGHNGIDEKGGTGGTLEGVLVYSPVCATVAIASTAYNYGRGTKVLLAWNEGGNKHWLTAQHFASINVRAGQVIAEGQLLGVEGWTGDVSPANVGGSHTHWEYNVGGVLQSYGEVKGGTVLSPAHLICVENKVGVYPVSGWEADGWTVQVEYASIGDRFDLHNLCKALGIGYFEGVYNGVIQAPQGNNLATVTMGPMSPGDLNRILDMCNEKGLQVSVHN